MYPDDLEASDLFEGAKKQVVVNAYERSIEARDECIKNYGYQCVICKFDFEKIYGAIGKFFIHVHHVKPLSEIGEGYKINPIEDLRPVCPNCHAMLHKRKPSYSIEEIKK
ncbi:restriction endonuclease [Sulfurospirillum sp. SCADC]|nr:restriction endonuclease [Sulfurospirillum sp. SCADC]